MITKFAKTKPLVLLFGAFSCSFAMAAGGAEVRAQPLRGDTASAAFAVAQQAQAKGLSIDLSRFAHRQFGPLNHTSANPSPLASTDWIRQIVTAEVPAIYDSFGASVETDGTTVLVGASQAVEFTAGPGFVNVYEKTATGWVFSQKLVPSDGVIGDGFGHAVAVEGDTAVISSVNAQIGDNENQGAVYIFSKIAGSWVQTQKLSPADGTAGRWLGATLALSGDHALVGTPAGFGGDDIMVNPVFAMRRVDGVWSFTQTFTSSDFAPGDFFGFDVAVDGNRALIGAPTAVGFAGAAYVFEWIDGTWTQTQKLVASDGAESDVFGWTVGIEGDVIVVGAPWQNRGAVTWVGAAYVFTPDDGNWIQTQKLGPVIADSNVAFAMNVDVSGNSILSSTGWGLYTEGVRSNGGAWVYNATNDEGYVLDSVFYAPDLEVGGFAQYGALAGGTMVLGAQLQNDYTGYATIHTRDGIFKNDFEASSP